MALPLNVQKRILSDINELNKDEDLKKNGIFWHINEDDMTNVWVVIFGSENTPYAFCPFLFKFEFTNKYPLMPPKGVFLTSDRRTRFNPNLYVEGKICLSILGTWSGPCWTPVMTLKTVIMSIIALVMNENPLVNEPGYEKSAKKDLDEYNQVVQYRSIDYAFCSQLKNLPEHFIPISEEIMNYAKEVFPKLYDLTKELKDKYEGLEVKPRYGAHAKLNYELTLEKLEEFKEKFIPELKEEVKKRLKREKAELMEEGYEIEEDGVKYRVKVNKSGKKYWSKKK